LALRLSGKGVGILLAVASMAAVVVLSNILVQHPFQFTLGRLNLADLLTWGAFSYPLAFLVTDTTNRLLGRHAARLVVYLGFAIAVALSVYFATPRIAIASGTAFLIGQLLDIAIFNRLVDRSWWQAPSLSSLAGSAADTLAFFSLAFAPMLALIGPNDAFAVGVAPFLGLYPFETQRWLSWAFGDFSVKLLMAIVALIPYRAIVGHFVPLRPVTG
jgi:uncharacterized PurR-regulated membrane protein YhhQ (DUF165 family)